MPDTPSDETKAASKPRVLACLQCQQRKVKCNRKFPCESCDRFQLECVPALRPRQRRRRFPERVLLDRLRHYEDLLRQNGTNFEPLHPESQDQTAASRSSGQRGGSPGEDNDELPDLKTPGGGTSISPAHETVYENNFQNPFASKLIIL